MHINRDEEFNMISWAVTFLVIALIAAFLGFSGIAGTAVHIAWILAVVGIVFAIVFGVLGRRPPMCALTAVMKRRVVLHGHGRCLLDL
jgi:uncharacterized membrane protein YtjA (UPF0391 family)